MTEYAEYVGNIQGVTFKGYIVPQEIYVLNLRDDKDYFHLFVQVEGSYPSQHYVTHNIHGIPYNYGCKTLGNRLVTFFGKNPFVLYAKGEQQIRSFKQLLSFSFATVSDVGQLKLDSNGKKCRFHEEKLFEFSCAQDKCVRLKKAIYQNKFRAQRRFASINPPLPQQPSHDPPVTEHCFFHDNRCNQPKGLCRLLWGTGTFSVLNGLWMPACISCQEPLITEDDKYFFCVNVKCVKFNTCVLKKQSLLNNQVKYLSGVCLNDEDFKRKFITEDKKFSSVLNHDGL